MRRSDSQLKVLVLGAFLVAAAASLQSHATVTTYANTPGRTASTVFTAMTVGGTAVSVDKYKLNSYARFSMGGTGTVSVVVTANATVDTCTVTPASYAITTTKSGTTCTFSLNLATPRTLQVQINALEKLFVFADPLEVSPPVLGGTNVYDVTTYGNVYTNGTKSTGIQAAIDNVNGKINCTNAAPCTLYFKNGDYLSVGLNLKSKVKLYLQSGARLKGSVTPADYASNADDEKAFILLSGVSYSGVYGRGVLDGGGNQYRFSNNAGSGYPRMGCQTDTAYACIDTPYLLRVSNSNDINVSGIYVRDPGFWSTHIHYSNNVIFDGLRILGGDSSQFNDDAVDVDASTNVTVKNMSATPATMASA